jgi:hypothetical protein
MQTEYAKGIGIARGKQGSDARAEVVQSRGFAWRRGQVRHGAILAEAAGTANWRSGPSCVGVLIGREVGLPDGEVQDKVGDRRLISEYL